MSVAAWKQASRARGGGPRNGVALYATPGKILLVEDDAVDAERMRRWLTDLPSVANQTVHWARTLAEALEVLRHHTPSVVLADLTLPDARDVETVSILVKHAPLSPLIVQTGIDDERTPIRALELGAQDYLVKGSMTKDLLDRSLRYAITRQRTQANLNQTAAKLEQTDGDLDDFSYVVAHDLRAPVRTARLFADRLLTQLPADNELAMEFGERLDVALKRVDGMIVSMLDYSELRGASPEPVAVPLARTIEQACSSVKADILEHNTQITIDIDENLRVMADSDLLIRVAVNLLANAMKFQRPDVALRLSVKAEADDGTVAVRFVDNGIGVPQADAERVFRILERLDPASTSGQGFGLAICRRIIKGFGGSIQIVAQDGPGTTFEIQLPQAIDS